MASPSSSAAVSARQLWFTGVGQVEIREQDLPAPGPGEVLVRTECSAISAGTELLVYRGQIPSEMPLDASLESLQSAPVFPLQYGYCSVGRVETVGKGVHPGLVDKLVFAFQPHASHFLGTAQSVIAVPDNISPQTAVFLANMETAVNLVHDGNPLLGEKVVVLGQGIVGLLLSKVLGQFPLAGLYAIESIQARRACALQAGVHQVADPQSGEELKALQQAIASQGAGNGADLIYEVSGVPAALNTAIALSGYATRIVIGSWYGSKSAAINLGGLAHRNRLRITTSQVSTLAPELSGRWDKDRRFDLSWQLLQQLEPAQLITHRVPLEKAAALYSHLHQQPDDVLQAVLTYP